VNNFRHDEAIDDLVSKLPELLERMKKAGFVEDVIYGQKNNLLVLLPTGQAVRNFIRRLAAGLGCLSGREIYLTWLLLTGSKSIQLDEERLQTRGLLTRMSTAGFIETTPSCDSVTSVCFSPEYRDSLVSLKKFTADIGPLTRREVVLIWTFFRLFDAKRPSSALSSYTE